MKTLIVAMLLMAVSGCRMVDGGVQDSYHLLGLIGDQTSQRREKIERKDIMAEQDRLNKNYQRFIITMPDDLK